MWYIVLLNKGELYMKRLLILLCMSTLVSCGIKNKFLNSSSGTLGVPKQPTEENATTELVFVESTQHESKNEQSEVDTTLTTETTNQPDESFFKWYYAVPFVGLAILAFLVYRLKQQNLKSL